MAIYVGKHEKDGDSVFDAMLAEIVGEHNDRLRKFERTHYVRNDGKAIRKDKRKAKYSRKIRYADRDLDDRFPNKGKSMYMTIRKYRDDMAESVRRSDYDSEINPAEERYVGKTTLQKQVLNKYAEMMKIREDFCKANQLDWDLDDYAKTSVFGFVVFYPAEYYQAKEEYEMLAEKRDKAFQRKIEKGKSVDNGSLWTVNNKERWSEK